MADDELDDLYDVPPKDFTAERARLTAAAKQRGDDDAAQRISAANKPTTAAWIVNRLALRRKDTRERLADLGERLRAAHAAMDGARIRDLSAEQRTLIDELTRDALHVADVKQPSASVREDLTSTLQAAIADPQARARLGRLTRPEQWSGFGAFGDAAPGSSRKKSPSRRGEKLGAAVAAAERAKADADDRLTEREAQRDEARQHRDEAARALRRAERELASAEHDYDKAKEASRAAADALKEAKARLTQG
ncbi:hypothetical protein JF781_20835 [Mycobacterium sp. WUMAC-067]|uniref:hypothetical protein n=1 Tax=unclassified Mycobacterium TaxID=2642494 RepID=UPI001CDA062E|nr:MULTISPECIES: hypothetical protein [unclassified Mycobacterium]MCA2244805.1 hypothetical protein [Mycobacterium sp. WUMAC-067]MCA2316139.1 hypothetical protein [Mycobacterium sp. WUMAC-025]